MGRFRSARGLDHLVALASSTLTLQLYSEAAVDGMVAPQPHTFSTMPYVAVTTKSYVPVVCESEAQRLAPIMTLQINITRCGRSDPSLPEREESYSTCKLAKFKTSNCSGNGACLRHCPSEGQCLRAGALGAAVTKGDLLFRRRWWCVRSELN